MPGRPIEDKVRDLFEWIRAEAPSGAVDCDVIGQRAERLSLLLGMIRILAAERVVEITFPGTDQIIRHDQDGWRLDRAK